MTIPDYEAIIDRLERQHASQARIIDTLRGEVRELRRQQALERAQHRDRLRAIALIGDRPELAGAVG